MADKEYPVLDTPIDEEVEVERLHFEISSDGKTAIPKTVKEKITVKTIYSKKQLYSNICSGFDHLWTVPDTHEWVAVCTKCPKRRYLNPLNETVIDGKIVDRSSKQQIA